MSSRLEFESRSPSQSPAGQRFPRDLFDTGVTALAGGAHAFDDVVSKAEADVHLGVVERRSAASVLHAPSGTGKPSSKGRARVKSAAVQAGSSP